LKRCGSSAKHWVAAIRGHYALRIALAGLGVLVLGAAGLLLGAETVSVQAALADPVSIDAQILWRLRLPRVLLSALAGAGLGMSGVLMQTYFRNPLAEPYITGVSAGGALGAVVATALGLTGVWAIGGSSILGSALITIALIAFSLRAPAGSYSSLLLLGMALGTLCGAGVWLVLLRQGPGGTDQVVSWMLGRVATVNYTEVLALSLLVAIGAALSLRLVPELDALLLGEEKAVSLGIDLAAVRRLVLTAAVVLSGGCVAFCGVIAFVGLIVPHIARIATGAAHGRLLPASAVLGALLVLAVDLVSRTVDIPREIPLTIVTSLVGAPFFIWVLVRSRENYA
jgi:iron complex transport system permease protein